MDVYSADDIRFCFTRKKTTNTKLANILSFKSSSDQYYCYYCLDTEGMLSFMLYVGIQLYIADSSWLWNVILITILTEHHLRGSLSLYATPVVYTC